MTSHPFYSQWFNSYMMGFDPTAIELLPLFRLLPAFQSRSGRDRLCSPSVAQNPSEPEFEALSLMEQTQLGEQTVVTLQDDWASFFRDPVATLHSFQDIFNSMEDGVILLNYTQNTVFINKAAVALFGSEIKCLFDQSCLHQIVLKEITLEELEGSINSPLVRFLRGQDFEGEEIGVEDNRTGKKVWLRVNSKIFRDAAGHLQGGMMIGRDITHYKEVEERLIHDAYHDKLTGLGNRKLLLEHLNRAIAYHRQDQEYHFAVLCLDIDRFKVINDSLGHVMGDHLLMAMTRRLETCLREDDLIVRLGGDEFAILLENIQEVACAMQVAQRIHQALTYPFRLAGEEIFTDISIGIAVNTTHYSYAEEMVRDADIALVHAKKLGLSTYQVFEPKMHTHTVELLQIENDLRRAIENQELQVYYQPIINLSNREISGFETLVRWQHPTRGFIDPGDFIPLAEETGLIIPIGRFVLEQACSKMQQWHYSYPQSKDWVINVNVSGKQLCKTDFIAELQEILKQTKILPENLKLEVTESVFLNQVPRVMEILHELEALGIQLALDDFGTGYSSLSYLHRLPFKTLKIDRSFVHDLEFNNDKLGILRAIVSLATHLEMDVVAEGIETPHQMAQLKALKCEYGQGYLFSKPRNSEQIEAWFQAEFLSQQHRKGCNLRVELAEQISQEELVFKIETLAQELEKIKREKEDLEILLETTAQHADLFELELNREILLYEKSKQSLQEKNELLKELCLVDSLTQVANRRHFDQYIEDVWAQLMAEQSSISFILLDVDYFKNFNDCYGHQVGDDCLYNVAQAISQPMRNTTDLVARYGGEEFVIILPHCGPEGALRVAERIRQELKQLNIPHAASLVSDRITVSLGIVTTTPSPDSSIEKLIESADQALYAAKLQGRDRYILFSQ